MLPPDLPEIPGFLLASFYRAAGQHNEVGGDFYDAFEVPGGWMVVVGDVAGRGAEAAALTSLSRYTFRTAGKLLGDPIAALEQLNAALRERPGLSLVSVCCALLRSATARRRRTSYSPAILRPITCAAVIAVERTRGDGVGEIGDVARVAHNRREEPPNDRAVPGRLG